MRSQTRPATTIQQFSIELCCEICFAESNLGSAILVISDQSGEEGWRGREDHDMMFDEATKD